MTFILVMDCIDLTFISKNKHYYLIMCLLQSFLSIDSEKLFLIYSQNKEISKLGQTFFKILRDKNIESQLLKHPRKIN